GAGFLARQDTSTCTTDVIMVGTSTLAVTRSASMNRATRLGSNAGTMTHLIVAGRLPAPADASFIPRPLIAPCAHCVHESSLAVITMTGRGDARRRVCPQPRTPQRPPGIHQPGAAATISLAPGSMPGEPIPGLPESPGRHPRRLLTRPARLRVRDCLHV